MDDLLGEDWQAPARSTTTSQSNPAAFASNYSSFRASPQPTSSGFVSPQSISRPSSTVNGTKGTAHDSFGNLLTSKTQKSGSNLTIQERQKQVSEEKRRRQQQHSQLWDRLESGRGTPELRQPSPRLESNGEQADILAAFNKAAPVDSTSHFPPPASDPVTGRNTPAVAQTGQAAGADIGGFDEDDDPFGLGALSQRSNGHVTAQKLTATDADDILGALGKPVEEKPEGTPFIESPAAHDSGNDEDGPVSADVRPPKPRNADRALTELIEMGFPADTAKIAVADNRGDVQSAVGWLLQQAHEESRQKARADAQPRRRSPHADTRSSPNRQRMEQDGVVEWMKQEGRSSSAARRQDSGSPARGEKDATQVAQELGNKVWKGANSLWRASQKQMVKTMAEFQQERDHSQPKWMQDASAESSRASSQRRPEGKSAPRHALPPEVDLTDEAAMLAAPRQDRPTKPPRTVATEHLQNSPARGRSPVEPLPQRSLSQPKFMRHAPPPQDSRPATKLSRQEIEDQTAQAYVSPARRKRLIPRPEPQPEQGVDLFTSAPTKPAEPASSQQSAKTMSVVPPSPTPARPKVTPRSIPSVSPSALSTSAQHRKKGGECFKRGDYAAAHEHYTSALTPLPATHPILIVVLSNRSLTALKTGDAKTAVSDADRALEIIGVSLGVGESIDLGAGEGVKDMQEFYGKALMRKAEALEHLEKWSDAAAVWRQAVEASVGGAVSLRGRDRCEKATTPQAATTASKSTRSSMPVSSGAPPPAKSLGNSMQRPTLPSAVSAEAVKKLRAANAAAEKADDEKFALTDQVDARLTAWKGGKADNLRALLQSLDTVLWEGAGWKKVGMSDLVIPSKVKIVYMKAIAKVHPDKIPQDATTEQRMISAAVFSTLNEAWDKFKADNAL